MKECVGTVHVEGIVKIILTLREVHFVGLHDTIQLINSIHSTQNISRIKRIILRLVGQYKAILSVLLTT